MRLRTSPVLIFVLTAALLGPAVALGQRTPHDREAALAFFEKKIRPLMVDNCYNCHSANTNARGGLRVDDLQGMLLGGEHGPAVVPGRPDDSLLLRAVSHTDDELKMPPNKQLSAEQVADLTRWIAEGAAWPAVEVPADLVASDSEEYERLRRSHWAWQPIQTTALPTVRDTSWAFDPIDTYLLAELEAHGLKPVADADATALVRRVTFDLTGLPPTPEEMASFAADPSREAYARLVDRLLASPAFGERWGRHWLDVARYGESTGSSRNVPYPQAWRYRDYVIDALNDDKPYDQFIREQVAGDLLPASSPQQRDLQRVATGFLALGVKDVNQRFKVRFIMDNVDEQIDTVTRSVLALTASCARCHDHKFDPIPTADYYALAGIFRSTDLCAGVRNKMGGGGMDYYDTDLLLVLGRDETSGVPPQVASRLAQVKAELESARADVAALRETSEESDDKKSERKELAQARDKVKRLQQELVSAADPVTSGLPVALGVRDARAVADTEIRIRGEAEKLGPVVPRGFLSVVEFGGQPEVNPAQSGRLELARWLTDEHNPLTPRVMVNRIWQHLFGEGLVRSVDNFGTTGDVPSHPELLDYLAARFVQNGWSVKSLVRSLVLSRAYQLSADAPDEHLTADPANRLVWRHSPRRLEAEELRDAALYAAGSLDRRRPDGSPAMKLKVKELPNNGNEAKALFAAAGESTHRSAYLPLVRGLAPRSLAVFDLADQGMVTGHRDTTTVVTQALYLLNDPFVRRQALALSDRLLESNDSDDPSRIEQAYRLALSREATSAEIERGLAYLADYEIAARQLFTPLPEPAQVASVDDPPNATTDSGPEAIEPVATRKPAGEDTDIAERADKPAKKRGSQESAGDVPQPTDPRRAAWASFCQALLGSSEFQYLK